MEISQAKVCYFNGTVSLYRALSNAAQYSNYLQLDHLRSILESFRLGIIYGPFRGSFPVSIICPRGSFEVLCKIPASDYQHKLVIDATIISVEARSLTNLKMLLILFLFVGAVYPLCVKSRMAVKRKSSTSG